MRPTRRDLVEKVSSTNSFIADFITLHTPLSGRNRNIIDGKALGAMKKGVRIINCARGGLVDEVALRAALDRGHVAGAAFDVFTEEPAAGGVLLGVPMWCARSAWCADRRSAENVALQIAEQMSDYLLRGAISNAVNLLPLAPKRRRRLNPSMELRKSSLLPAN